MRIIVLEGMPNKGKTTTMWLVHDLLLAAGGISTAFKPTGLGVRAYIDDFEDEIVSYKSLKVGVYSTGDYSNELMRAIRRFKSIGCDVFICTLSKNTPKLNANKEINKHSPTRISKTVEITKALQSSANSTDANTIFAAI